MSPLVTPERIDKAHLVDESRGNSALAPESPCWLIGIFSTVVMAAVEFSSVAVEISVIKLVRLILVAPAGASLELKNSISHFNDWFFSCC